MTFQTALDKLYSKYGKYGFSRDCLAEHLRSGIMEQGFSVDVSYNGLRLALAHETGEYERFSVGDIAEALGESEAAVLKRVDECKAEPVWQSSQGLPS